MDIVIPYAPRPQFIPYHERSERWAVLVCHRRAGKTVATINDLIRDVLTSDKPEPRVAYVAPTYVQAKDVAWEYAKQFSAAIPGVGFNESELRIDYPSGGRLRLYGAENAERMRGLYFDSVVLDEAADFAPSVWPQIIRPALADRQGRATFIGTPKGKTFLWQVWDEADREPGWYRLMLKASETGIIQASELAQMRRTMSEDEYDQELECSFEAAIKGAYYGDDIRRMRESGRVSSVPVDRYLPVHTAWDLGISDATAIWFLQLVGREVRLVDFIEHSGLSLADYADKLRGWASAHGVRYGTHYLPHDIAVRELSSGKSRLQTLRELGLDDVRVVPQHHVLDGINATRRMLDRTWADKERCREGLELLSRYRSEQDEKTGLLKPKPRHDETSHAADALRQFAAAYDEPAARRDTADKYRRSERSKVSWMAA